MKLRLAWGRLALVVGLGFGVARPGSAATFTWIGAGANGNFSNPANWLGGVVPPSDGTATVVFANINHGPTAYLDVPYNLGSITLSGILPSTSTYGGAGRRRHVAKRHHGQHHE